MFTNLTYDGQSQNHSAPVEPGQGPRGTEGPKKGSGLGGSPQGNPSASRMVKMALVHVPKDHDEVPNVHAQSNTPSPIV